MKNNLKEIMQEKGISIRGLSDLTEEKTGKRVSTSTIQKIRKGENCEFGPVQRIAAALGIDVEILFGGKNEK
jgi:DNA-binding Xre family transcriptional regulator